MKKCNLDPNKKCPYKRITTDKIRTCGYDVKSVYETGVMKKEHPEYLNKYNNCTFLYSEIIKPSELRVTPKLNLEGPNYLKVKEELLKDITKLLPMIIQQSMMEFRKISSEGLKQQLDLSLPAITEKIVKEINKLKANYKEICSKISGIDDDILQNIAHKVAKSMQAEAVMNDDKIKSIQDGLESSFITLKEKYINDWIDRSNLKISKSFQEQNRKIEDFVNTRLNLHEVNSNKVKELKQQLSTVTETFKEFIKLQHGTNEAQISINGKLDIRVKDLETSSNILLGNLD